MKPTRLLPALALVLALVPATRGQGKPERLPLDDRVIDASLGTDWYGVYFKGKKIGYYTIERTRGENGATLTVAMKMSVKMVSLGQKTEFRISQRVEFQARAPYRLLGAALEQADGEVALQVQLKRDGESFAAAVSAAGEKRTKKVALDYTLQDELATEAWLRRKPAPGDRLAGRELDLEDLKTYGVAHRYLGSKQVFVAGVPLEYHEVESVSDKLGVKSFARLDGKGRMLSGTIADQFELRKESEADAKNTEFSADVFVLGMVKLDKTLGDPREVTSLVLEVAGADGVLFKSGPRQAVTPGKGGPLLKLGKAHGTPVKATPKEIEENLAETANYPISLPKVKELAQKAVGDAKEPRDKVRRLVKFVHDFVTPSLAGGMPRLEDLLQRKQGDCKSYALLFTALARASGLPAREVGGLMYLGDAARAFGGHAWNEVVIDGVWVPVDCSLNEAEVNATHISFGTERDWLGNMLGALGKLSFRLVEVERSR